MLDAIVIGGGPAGLAAAVYLARQKIPFMVLAGTVGGQAMWSTGVENYLGFHLLDGASLVDRFKAHIKEYESLFTLKEGEEVERVDKIGGGFAVTTKTGRYEARTLLITTGTRHRKLGIPGENEFYGKGVTYCATCDAPIFRGKTVAVVGGGNSAMEAALFAAKYAARVILVTINPELRGDAVLKEKTLSHPSVEVRANAKTMRVTGGDIVAGIVIRTPEGGEQTENVEGVFIEIGLEPVSGFINFVGKDHAGQIIVDKFNATDVEGIWAAGDVTDVTEKQIAVAVGEGSKAALSLIKHLERTRNG